MGSRLQRPSEQEVITQRDLLRAFCSLHKCQDCKTLFIAHVDMANLRNLKKNFDDLARMTAANALCCCHAFRSPKRVRDSLKQYGQLNKGTIDFRASDRNAEQSSAWLNGMRILSDLRD